MSTGGPNTQRFSPFTPPLRGSFPLDRSHICNPLVEDYLNCLRDYNRKESGSGTGQGADSEESGSEICRPLARKYLECRMKAGLMTEEDLKSLGY